MKKHILLAFAMILTSATGLLAQKVWTEPEVIIPSDTLKIYIDLSQMDCDKLLGTTDPLYIWTWMPADPVNGNGDWSNSNTDNEWESIGNEVYRFTMIPTEFYGVDAQTVYDNDIFFLAKALDGGSGGDCSAAGDENKTEDITIAVDPPTGGAVKVFPFPSFVDGDSLGLTQEDIFSVFYDNSIEDKVTMQNAGDLFVYPTAFDLNGNTYRPATIGTVGSTPSLQMTKNGTLYNWTIQPKSLFNIPDGEVLDYIQLQVVKPVIVNSDDTVDGTFNYFFRCN